MRRLGWLLLLVVVLLLLLVALLEALLALPALVLVLKRGLAQADPQRRRQRCGELDAAASEPWLSVTRLAPRATRTARASHPRAEEPPS